MPERLPEEDHGLSYVRLFTNMVILGSLVTALLLGGRDYSAGVFLAGVFMALYALGLRFAQRRLYHVVPYFLAQVGFLVALVVLTVALVPAPDGSKPDIFLALIVVVIGFGTILLAVGARLSGRRLVYPSVYLVIYPVGVYLASFVFGRPQLRLLAYFVEAVLLVLCLIYLNRRSLTRAFFEAQGYRNVPYGKIKHANTRKMLGMTLLSVAIFCVFALFDNGGALLYRIADWFKGILRWLASLLSMLPDEDQALTESAIEKKNPFFEIGDILPEAKENPAMEAFWNTVLVILGVIAAVLVVSIIISAIRNFLREFRLAQKENGDVAVYAPPPEVSVIRRKDRGPGFFDRSPEAKVRRLYLGFIKKQPGARKVRPYETPVEIEATAGVRRGGDVASGLGSFAGVAPSEKEGVQEIHELYERVRYSGKETSPEDVRRMRTAIRNTEKG